MGNALAGRQVAITRLPARRTVLGWRCHLSSRLDGCSFPLTDEETPEAMSTRGRGHQRGGALWINSRAPNPSACEVYTAEALDYHVTPKEMNIACSPNSRISFLQLLPSLFPSIPQPSPKSKRTAFQNFHLGSIGLELLKHVFITNKEGPG